MTVFHPPFDRTVVVGDVHGCIDELRELLDNVQLRAADRLVFLGDLMDRGPEPVACVRLVREVGAECIASNHDEKHVRWRAHHHREAAGGKNNPIRFTKLQAEQNLELRDEEIAWIAGLPMSIDLGHGWHAIHAGLEPSKTFEEQSDSPALLRTRFINEDGTAYTAKDADAPDPTDKWFWSQRWRGPESIVYGHHIHRFAGPRIDEKTTDLFGPGRALKLVTCIGIDTGCYAGGRLTAMILQEGSYAFEHVDARRVYQPLSDKYGANRPQPLSRAKEAQGG